MKPRSRRRFSLLKTLLVLVDGFLSTISRPTGAFLRPKNHRFHASTCRSPLLFMSPLGGGTRGSAADPYQTQQYRPIPDMPSQLFQQLALSQLELLASSITTSSGRPKIKSMALYLPQENVKTGQLEFLPAVRFPHPSSERIFIASDSESGVAPQMPRTLTTLPGFAHATTLLPGYPMVSSGSSTDMGIGVVEEVFCELGAGGGAGGAALSVPLLSGSQTVGVLLASPSVQPKLMTESVWTTEDRKKVAQAAKSLSLALSMDAERSVLQMRNQKVHEALSDGLHQVKNPLQALRTFGKLLQRRIADGDETMTGTGMTPQLLELADHLLVQSDRLVDRLKPVDALVESLAGTNGKPHLLQPGYDGGKLTRFQTPLLPEGSEPALSLALVPSSSRRNEAVLSKNKSKTAVESTTGSRIKNGNVSIGHEEALKTSPTSTPSPLISESSFEVVFVGDLLQPLFASYKAIAADRGILFKVCEADDLPGVLVCPEALEEVVSNIIDNALKYVDIPQPERLETYPPTVRVRLLPNDTSKKQPGVTILVEDNGPGVEPHERELIFQRGYRGGKTAGVKGKGIGLDIARSLVEQMGGTLRVADDCDFPVALLNGTVMETVFYRKPPTA